MPWSISARRNSALKIRMKRSRSATLPHSTREGPPALDGLKRQLLQPDRNSAKTDVAQGRGRFELETSAHAGSSCFDLIEHLR